MNAINFVQNYDAKLSEINWARGEDDVSSMSSLRLKQSITSPPTERLPLDVFDTSWIFWLDDDCVSGHHLDVFNTSDARVFLQQLSGCSSSLPAVLHYDVLPSS